MSWRGWAGIGAIAAVIPVYLAFAEGVGWYPFSNRNSGSTLVSQILPPTPAPTSSVTPAPVETPTPTADLQATVSAIVAATVAALPTPTPAPTPTSIPTIETPEPPATPTEAPTPIPQVGDVLYEADWSDGMNGWSGSTDWKHIPGTLVSDGFPLWILTRSAHKVLTEARLRR